ncbi:ceramide synthase 1-like [Actinia tenebrosa]|uniref:Ceramide synthase 1-like n=1 Tax=Actinia tenebrosa TaxID=6105 RepID=A0A6P8I7V0_ACTTE|nr:ceramide synthase 1-like [Actinia tenebrosa]
MASNYLEIFPRIWESFLIEWKTSPPTSNFLQNFIKDCSRYGVIKKEDLYLTFLLAIFFTLQRYAATAFFFKPIANYFQFIKKDKEKFPESAWKLFYYFSVYCYCTYTLFSHRLMENPRSIWKGWERGMAIPNDIYNIYVVEAGFYFHSIYATIYMDKWRRDSVVMILHHILANSLIIFSFAMRYHNIGIIVLYLHDISDIFLESTKIFLCFKSAPGRQQTFAGYLVNVGFLSFAFSWFYCRLYQYPHKVLYSTGHFARHILPDAPFYFFFNGLLWMLFAMNIWWFHFVLWLIWRVVNGESREVEDTREIEKSKEPLKSHSANGDVVNNGVHEKNNILKTSNKINKLSNDEQIKKKEEKDKQVEDKDITIPQHRKKHLQGN